MSTRAKQCGTVSLVAVLLAFVLYTLSGCRRPPASANGIQVVPPASTVAADEAALFGRLLADNVEVGQPAEADPRILWDGGPRYSVDFDAYLDAMHEPRLHTTPQLVGAEMYRFLWRRSYHSPVSVRATWAEERGTLTSVVLAPFSDEEGMKIASKNIRVLSRVEWSEITSCFDPLLPSMRRVLPAPPDAMETAWATWLVDGFRHNTRVLVERWSPEGSDAESRAFRRCCLLMLRLGGVEPREVY